MWLVPFNFYSELTMNLTSSHNFPLLKAIKWFNICYYVKKILPIYTDSGIVFLKFLNPQRNLSANKEANFVTKKLSKNIRTSIVK